MHPSTLAKGQHRKTVLEKCPWEEIQVTAVLACVDRAYLILNGWGEQETERTSRKVLMMDSWHQLLAKYSNVGEKKAAVVTVSGLPFGKRTCPLGCDRYGANKPGQIDRGGYR